nr:hypothetical protein CFP56_65886 [Quercus suber]
MQSAADTEQVVSLFQRRGMLFQEQKTNGAIAQGNHAGPTSQTIPAPSHSRHFELIQPDKPTALTPQQTELSSVSCRIFGGQGKGTGAPLHIPPHTQKAMQQTRLPPSPKRSEVSDEPEPASGAATTTQIFRSSTSPYRRSQASTDIAQQIQSEPFDPNLSMLGSPRKRILEDVHYRNSPLRNQSAIRTSWQETSMPQTSITEIAAVKETNEKPQPLPTSSNPSPNLPFPETLEHEIPPRRELPFDKRPSSSRQSGSDQSGSRPGTALVPLTKTSGPDTTKFGSGNTSIPTGKALEQSRPQSASPLKRTALTAFDDARRPQSAIGPRTCTAISKASVPPPSTRLVENETAAGPEKSIHRHPRMDELLYGKRSLAERSANLPSRLGSLADAPHVVDDQLPIPPRSKIKSISDHSTAAPAVAAAAHDPSLRAYAATLALSTSTTGTSASDSPENTSAPANLTSLETYAAQSAEDRHAALDEFMAQHLENPAFTTLCEDVESCWRRIALGL